MAEKFGEAEQWARECGALINSTGRTIGEALKRFSNQCVNGKEDE